MKIEQITLAITNMPEMIAFYNGVFDAGLVQVGTSPFYKGTLAGTSFLFCPNEIAGVEAKQNRHQLRVAVSNLDEVVRRVTQFHGIVINEGEANGRKIIGVRDPEGNSYELIEVNTGLKVDNHPDREKLEQAIVDLERNVDFSETDFGWVFKASYADYLKAWSDLGRYYERHYDENIRFIRSDVLKSFLDTTSIYCEGLNNRKYLPVHGLFEDKLAFMEHTFNAIIAEGYMELNDMPEDTSPRGVLEAHIMDSATKKNMGSGLDWLSCEAMTEYLQAWSELADFYEAHPETNSIYVRCDVLSTFLVDVNAINILLDKRHPSFHERANVILTTLQTQMDRIIAAGQLVLKNQAS